MTDFACCALYHSHSAVTALSALIPTSLLALGLSLARLLRSLFRRIRFDSTFFPTRQVGRYGQRQMVTSSAVGTLYPDAGEPPASATARIPEPVTPLSSLINPQHRVRRYYCYPLYHGAAGEDWVMQELPRCNVDEHEVFSLPSPPLSRRQAPLWCAKLRGRDTDKPDTVNKATPGSHDWRLRGLLFPVTLWVLRKVMVLAAWLELCSRTIESVGGE